MNLSDSDLLEILLTSEFDDVQKKEDFKFLLFKFRYFYRNLYSRFGSKSGDLNSIKKSLEDKISSLEKEIDDLKIKNANLQNKIDLSPKPKKFRFFNF